VGTPRTVAVAAALVAGLAVSPSVASTRTAAPSFFHDCAPSTSAPKLTVGKVTCQQIPSAAIGGTTAFSYYVPPGCAPALKRRCPVIYALHGFGGDYTSVLGTRERPSSYIAALTSGPAKDPFTVRDPWNYADTSKWVAKTALNAILVAPDGRTVPGGYGPTGGVDGFWVDWNPRYGNGGDKPKYQTPAPRFEAQLIDELIPYVERTFPVGSGRSWRSLAGVSLGGYGSYGIGLRHPDMFVSLGSVSGAMNFLFGPGLDAAGRPLPGPQVPVQGVGPVIHLPGLGANVPVASLPAEVQGFAVALLALGDPAADAAYFRGHMPRDLARNGYAHNTGGQVLDIRGFYNDAIAHNPTDVTDPGGLLGSTALEVVVLEMSRTQRTAFRQTDVAWDVAMHPGTHSEEYRAAWIRDLLSKQYALLRHADGGGSPRPLPTSFDFRSTDSKFSVWGWNFAVKRPVTEFLVLSDVTCKHLSFRATGRLTVTVPASCHTGWHGKRKFTVDIGVTHSVDDPGVGQLSPYGVTGTVPLTPL
jgi:S-formylglutathione hydrolase FrmB